MSRILPFFFLLSFVGFPALAASEGEFVDEFARLCLRGMPSIDTVKATATQNGYVDVADAGPLKPEHESAIWLGKKMREGLLMLELASTEVPPTHAALFDGSSITVCRIGYIGVSGPEIGKLDLLVSDVLASSPQSLVNNGMRVWIWDTLINFRQSQVKLTEVIGDKQSGVSLELVAPYEE